MENFISKSTIKMTGKKLTKSDNILKEKQAQKALIQKERETKKAYRIERKNLLNEIKPLRRNHNKKWSDVFKAKTKRLPTKREPTNEEKASISQPYPPIIIPKGMDLKDYTNDELKYFITRYKNYNTPKFNIRSIPLHNTDLYDKMDKQYFTQKVKNNQAMFYTFIVKYKFQLFGGSYTSIKVLGRKMAVKTETTQAQIIDDIITDWLEGDLEHYNRPRGSDPKILEVTNFQILEENKSKLKKIKMKGTKLLYQFLGDNDKIINTNKGQCVIDYIEFQINKTETGLKKKWSRENLINYFGGEKSLTEGISTKQIRKWAIEDGRVSFNALSPLMDVFDYWHADNARVCLNFICNNQHLYPIIDAQLCKSISEKHKVELDDIIFKVNYSDHTFVDKNNIDHNAVYFFDELQEDDEKMNSVFKNKSVKVKEPITKQLYCGTYMTDKKVVLIEIDDLKLMINKITHATNMIVTNMIIKNSTVTKFEHPVSNQIYICADDYKERKKVCNTLFAETNLNVFEFNNQSWTELALLYLQYVSKINIREADYSKDYMQVLGSSSKSSFVSQQRGNYRIGDVVSFDIVRCYSSILIENSENWGIPCSFDHIQKFDGDLVVGEYYVERVFNVHGITYGNDWYSLVWIKYALGENWITFDDIKHVIKFSGGYSKDYFKKFTEEIIEKFPMESKSIVNQLTGFFGKKFWTNEKGMLTDDYNTALGTYFFETEKHNSVTIDSLNNYFFLRSIDKKERTSGYVSIYRQIIDNSYIKLNEMRKKVGGTAVGYTTDSIKVVYPNKDIVSKIEHKMFMQNKFKPGDYKIENKVIIRGRYFDELQAERNEKPKFEYVKGKVNYIYETSDNLNEVIEFVKKNNCFIIGEAGCGKTEMIKRVYKKETDAVLTTTNQNCEVLRDRNVECKTMASTFNKFKKSKINIYGKNIHVDEYGMVETKFMRNVQRLKNDDIKIRLYGDSNQLPSVETQCIDYVNNESVLSMVDHNVVVLKYKDTRYDAEMHAEISDFMKTGILGGKFKTKKEKECWMNLCYTNKCRIDGNKKTFERFLKTFNPETKMIDGVMYAKGMYVICNTGEKQTSLKSQKIFNSNLFIIKSFGVDEITLTSYKDNTIDKTISLKLFIGNFDYGFYNTIHKFQGGCIKEEYCIHEIDHRGFNKNLMYTALTRGVTLGKVHFNWTGRLFTPQKFTHTCICYDKKNELTSGRIYMIEGEKWCYIGSTFRTLEERFNEHKTSPTNEEMQKVINDQGVKIKLIKEVKVISEDELEEYENDYIRTYIGDKDLLNVLGNRKKKKISLKKTETVVKIKKCINVNIKHCKNKFIINYRENEQLKQKIFRFNDENKESQLQKAELMKIELYKKQNEL